MNKFRKMLTSRYFVGANLREANLRGADLREAKLLGADLRGADLREAKLLGANLRGAVLEGADLSGADLSGADLRWANLRGADLREAKLLGANLRGANLREAKLLGADLEGANIPTIPNLETKVGWKKLFEGNVIELEITGNVVGCYTSTQLRTDRCIPRGSGRSFYDRNFIYEAGNECTSQLNEDPRECCAEGIHFFATREEAERW